MIDIFSDDEFDKLKSFYRKKLSRNASNRNHMQFVSGMPMSQRNVTQWAVNAVSQALHSLFEPYSVEGDKIRRHLFAALAAADETFDEAEKALEAIK